MNMNLSLSLFPHISEKCIGMVVYSTGLSIHYSSYDETMWAIFAGSDTAHYDIWPATCSLLSFL